MSQLEAQTGELTRAVSVEPSPRRAAWRTGLLRPLALAAVGMVTISWTFLFIRLTIDDAFITWRYGRNLVQYGVWDWNPSAGDTVEAYTNPIYAALSIFPELVDMPTELFFKLFSLALAAALWIFLSRAEIPPWQKVTALAIVFANPTFHVHLWAGLETPLFAALIAMTFGQVYMQGGLSLTGYLLAGALALTRPEGAGYALIVVSWCYIIRPSRRRLAGLIGLGLTVVAYWVIRGLYFQALFPNTFYIKTSSASFHSSLVSAASGLFGIGLLAVAVVSAGIVVARGRGHSTSRRHVRSDLALATPMVLAIASAGVASVVYRNSDLMMNYANRFEWQIIAPVIVVALLRQVESRNCRYVAATFAIVIGVALGNGGQEPKLGLLAISAAIIGMLIFTWGRMYPHTLLTAAVLSMAMVSALSSSEAVSLVTYRIRLEYAHGEIGTTLNQHRSHIAAFAIGDAGLAPYRADMQAIDIVGLANRSIGRGEFDGETIEALSPDVIFVYWAPRYVSPFPAEMVTTEYAQDPDQGFIFRKGVLWRPNYRLDVYYRRELPRPFRHDLEKTISRSKHLNREDDIEFLSRHLLDFPFLWRTSDG